MTGYVRSRNGVAAACWMLLATAVSIAVHATSVKLYFDPHSTTVRLGLLTPVLSVVAVHLSTGTPFGEMEAVFVRRLRRLRAAHLAALCALGAISALAYAAWHGAGGPLGQFVRNTAVLLGVLLMAVVVLGSDLAWVAPVGLAFATYGFGVDASRPRAWAVLLHDATPTGVLGACVLLAVAGLLFVAIGPRAAHSGDEADG
jgi:hypothetical protein